MYIFYIRFAKCSIELELCAISSFNLFPRYAYIYSILILSFNIVNPLH